MIYNFHIFDGNGNCLFSLNREEKEDSTKLLYGFLYSLKSFTQRIGPIMIRDNNFLTYSTNAYQLIFYEMPTSVKFVLIVTPDSTKNNDFYKQLLREMYRNVYVEYHVKNPIRNNLIIDSQLFREKLIEFFNKI
jgi:hypothetical protein